MCFSPHIRESQLSEVELQMALIFVSCEAKTAGVVAADAAQERSACIVEASLEFACWHHILWD